MASTTWSMQVSLELTPGAHTVEVKATKIKGAGENVVVSGMAESGLQGTLTVTTLKR
ncbi:MAG: hypothetical protein ABIZ96_09175 [Gemmatimonadales bacterium]